MSDIVVDSASVNFGPVRALNSVSLTLPAGGIYGIIGPNGSGKSTLLNAIGGVVQLTEGSISIFGLDTTGLRAMDVARLGVIRVFQHEHLFEELSVLDNLLVGGHARSDFGMWGAIRGGKRIRRSSRELLDEARGRAKQLHLNKVIANQARDLSTGQRRLLEIGRAMMAEPRVLLLDEPTAGLSPKYTAEVRNLLVELNQTERISMLLIEHKLQLIRDLAAKVAVLVAGSELTRGSPVEVLSNEEVVEAYLGSQRGA